MAAQQGSQRIDPDAEDYRVVFSFNRPAFNRLIEAMDRGEWKLARRLLAERSSEVHVARLENKRVSLW